MVTPPVPAYEYNSLCSTDQLYFKYACVYYGPETMKQGGFTNQWGRGNCPLYQSHCLPLQWSGSPDYHQIPSPLLISPGMPPCGVIEQPAMWTHVETLRVDILKLDVPKLAEMYVWNEVHQCAANLELSVVLH